MKTSTEQLSLSWTGWRVQIAKHIELVHARQRHKHHVDQKAHSSNLLVQSPVADAHNSKQKHHGGQQGDGAECEACTVDEDDVVGRHDCGLNQPG